VNVATQHIAGVGWRYRLLVALLSPLLVGHALWKSLSAKNTRYAKERLGFCRRAEKAEEWWHAASVGEIQTAWPLLYARVQERQANRADAHWLVSTNTVTGYAVLQQRLHAANLSDCIHHCYLPIDTVGSVQRFLQRRHPQRLIVVETELWPNLYHALLKQNVPTTIINARMTERTLNTVAPNHRLAKTMRPAYQSALQNTQVCARSEADAERFMQLGVSATNLEVIGDLKFADNRPTHCATPLQTTQLSHPYVVAASTHEPEELQIALHWMQDVDSGLLVIVPRHIERGKEIQQALLSLYGDAVAQQRSSGGAPNAQHRIYLADTLGELHDWYAGAAAAFVGGSLVQRGGHNVLEPYYHGIPVITGPHTGNFDDAMQWLQQHHGVQVGKDAKEIVAYLQVGRDVGFKKQSGQCDTAAALPENIVNDYLHALEKR